MNEKHHSPLRVAKATKERVGIPIDRLLGDRRWVINKDGKLEERFGPPQEGDTDAVRTVH